MEKIFKNFSQFVNEADISGNPAVTPEYLASLNKRAEAAVQKIERKHGPQMAQFMRFVMEAQAMERGKHKALEQLVKDIILDEYGAILGDTKLDIKYADPIEITSMMKKPNTEQEKDESPELPELQQIEDENTKIAIHKRKILNMITQGEALNAKKLFTGEVAMDGLNRIFGEQQAKKFIDLLIKITDIASAMDWRMPEDVALEMWEQGSGFSGASKVEWKPTKKDVEGGMGEDEDDEPKTEEESYEATIVARGIDFSMLVHESIKGLYSLINQGGLAHLDDETVRKVLMNTDTIADEIQDLKRSRLTASDLRDFLNTFKDVAAIQNGRQYVWGKMIDASVLSDNEFLELMRLIFISAPLYKSEDSPSSEYADLDKGKADEAFAKAKVIVQRLIDLIKKELSDWEEAQRPKSAYDDDYEDEDDVLTGGEEDDQPWLKEPDAPQPMSRREIQDLIDQALDRRDFAEASRLSQIKVDESTENDEP